MYIFVYIYIYIYVYISCRALHKAFYPASCAVCLDNEEQEPAWINEYICAMTHSLAYGRVPSLIQMHHD